MKSSIHFNIHMWANDDCLNKIIGFPYLYSWGHDSSMELKLWTCINVVSRVGAQCFYSCRTPIPFHGGDCDFIPLHGDLVCVLVHGPIHMFLFKIQLWSSCSLAQWPCHWGAFHLQMFLFPFVASVGKLPSCSQFMLHFVFLNANKFLPFLPISYSFECLQSLVFVVSNGGASSLHHMLFMF